MSLATSDLHTDLTGGEAALLGLRGGPVPEASLSQLQEAFRSFTEASGRFAEHYGRLEQRVAELNLELEVTNARLRDNLDAKERVQTYLSTLMESLPLGVVGLDRAGATISCNGRAVEILERDPSTLAGASVLDVFGAEAARRFFEDTIRDGFARQHGQEIAYTRPSDGRRRALSLLVTPTRRHEDGEAAAVLLIEDITDMRRLEEQASRTSRLAAMGEIAMNVAHEIRNPLGSIALFASMLQRDLAEDPAKERLADHISTGVRCLDHIVANILQFSRPQRLSCCSFSLGELVDDTLVYAEHAFRQKNIRIERDYGSSAVMLWADAELLRQTFLNLFLNAVQATPEGGAVGVSLIPNGRTVEIQLWDTGCGFAPDVLGRIFDPFYTTRRRGTGLGLTIVHNIISAHQGSIVADNRPEGGALFSIVLPKRASANVDGTELRPSLLHEEEMDS